MKKDLETTISSSILTENVQILLGCLKERPREILERRFGLSGQDPMVLGKIGDEFNVTRERIRQIESDSFKKLREAQKNKNFNRIESAALQTIKEAGGFCEKKELKKQIKKNVTQKQRNQLMFILNSSKKIKFKKGKLNMKGFWFASEDDRIDADVASVHDYIVKYIKEEKRPVTFSRILKKVRSEKNGKSFLHYQKAKKDFQ